MWPPPRVPSRLQCDESAWGYCRRNGTLWGADLEPAELEKRALGPVCDRAAIEGSNLIGISVWSPSRVPSRLKCGEGNRVFMKRPCFRYIVTLSS